MLAVFKSEYQNDKVCLINYSETMFKCKWTSRKTIDRRPGQELQTLEQPSPPPKQDYLDHKSHRTYSCIHCRAHLANHDELISKLFQGNRGRAYLFNKVVNIGCKKPVERELLTGLHSVADIYCDSCETILGWKYELAFVPSQKYKEGKYIIELVHMLKENNWDLSSHNTKELLDELDEKANISNTNYNRNQGSGSKRVNRLHQPHNKSMVANVNSNNQQGKSNRSHLVEFDNNSSSTKVSLCRAR